MRPPWLGRWPAKALAARSEAAAAAVGTDGRRADARSGARSQPHNQQFTCHSFRGGTEEIERRVQSAAAALLGQLVLRAFSRWPAPWCARWQKATQRAEEKAPKPAAPTGLFGENKVVVVAREGSTLSVRAQRAGFPGGEDRPSSGLGIPGAQDKKHADGCREVNSEASAVKTLTIVEAAREAEEELVNPLFQFRNYGQRLRHHWSTISFGTDYFTRTAVAKSNILVNSPDETKYFYQDLDETGAAQQRQKVYGYLPQGWHVAGEWLLVALNLQRAPFLCMRSMNHALPARTLN